MLSCAAWDEALNEVNKNHYDFELARSIKFSRTSSDTERYLAPASV